MTVSIRRSTVPKNSILLFNSDGNLPPRYSFESTLYGKFIKNISCIATNPGTSVGSTNHTETALSSHSHAVSATHTHSGTQTGSVYAPTNYRVNGSNTGVAGTSHKHDLTISSSSVSGSSSSVTDSHNHGSQSNEPVHKTNRFIKNTGSNNIRSSNQVPLKSIILSDSPVNSLPDQYSISCGFNGNFVKGVASCSASINESGGSSNHNHVSCGGSHSHTSSLSSHSHSASGSLANSYQPYTAVGNTSQRNVHGMGNSGHTHSVGSIALGSANVSGSTSTSSNHSGHGSADNDPSNHEYVFIERSSISIRKPGIPIKSSIMWICNIACAPSGFRVQDGNCGTQNTLGKHPKGIPNNCTNPGTNGGSATHTHSTTAGGHNHTISHTHGGSGISGLHSGGSRWTGYEGAGGAVRNDHTHYGGCSAAGDIVFDSDSDHTHASTTSDPDTIEVAILEKI